MTTNNYKLCVFCADSLNSENRSKEHVIPQWLLNFLGIREEIIEPTHFSSDGKTQSKRNHTLEGLLAGQVCESCNGGWMSKLEQEAIPILKPLINGERIVVELTDRERQIMGRWTAKTAYALNSSSNYQKNVPLEHYKFIRTNTESLPNKVSSFAQQHYGTRPFYWIQSPIWILHGDSDKLDDIGLELTNSSYKIAFQFGKLLLLIAFIPIETIYPVLWKGIHVPLIPKTSKCGFYEDDEFTWTDSEKALIEFHFGLQATIIID